MTNPTSPKIPDQSSSQLPTYVELGREPQSGEMALFVADPYESAAAAYARLLDPRGYLARQVGDTVTVGEPVNGHIWTGIGSAGVRAYFQPDELAPLPVQEAAS